MGVDRLQGQIVHGASVGLVAVYQSTQNAVTTALRGGVVGPEFLPCPRGRIACWIEHPFVVRVSLPATHSLHVLCAPPNLKRLALGSQRG